MRQPDTTEGKKETFDQGIIEAKDVPQSERKLMPDLSLDDLASEKAYGVVNTKVSPQLQDENPKPDKIDLGLFEGGEAIEEESKQKIIQSNRSSSLDKGNLRFDEQFENHLHLDQQHDLRRVSVIEKERERRSLDEKMRKEARKRLKIESRVPENQKFKTLHYGLKPNHERNVALIHPLMFLTRRIVYALVIVFMSEVMFFGALIVMLSCLAMLVYALHEWQWKDRIINQ